MNEDQRYRRRQRRKHERGLDNVGEHPVGVGGAKLMPLG